MDTQSPRPELIERLRAQIAHVGAPAREVGCLPFGIDAFDGKLSGRGLSQSALHEVSAGASSLVDDAAATLFLAGIAARLSSGGGTVVWAVTRFQVSNRSGCFPTARSSSRRERTRMSSP